MYVKICIYIILYIMCFIRMYIQYICTYINIHRCIYIYIYIYDLLTITVGQQSGDMKSWKYSRTQLLMLSMASRCTTWTRSLSTLTTCRLKRSPPKNSYLGPKVEPRNISHRSLRLTTPLVKTLVLGQLRVPLLLLLRSWWAQAVA